MAAPSSFYIPSKTEAIEGKNSLTAKSPNQLLNLRPNMFFDSMLIRKIEPEDQVIPDHGQQCNPGPEDKEIRRSSATICFGLSGQRVRNQGPNWRFRELIPERRVRFSSENLQPIEQVVYDRGRQPRDCNLVWTAADVWDGEVSGDDHDQASAGGIPDRDDNPKAGV